MVARYTNHSRTWYKADTRALCVRSVLSWPYPDLAAKYGQTGTGAATDIDTPAAAGNAAPTQQGGASMNAGSGGQSASNTSNTLDTARGNSNNPSTPPTTGGQQGGGKMNATSEAAYRHDFVPRPENPTNASSQNSMAMKIFATAIRDFGTGKRSVPSDAKERTKAIYPVAMAGLQAGYLPSEVHGRLTHAGLPSEDVRRHLADSIASLRGDEDEAGNGWDWDRIESDHASIRPATGSKGAQ